MSDAPSMAALTRLELLRPEGIIVGYDRSRHARVAVTWANQLAAALTRPLWVVWAWRVVDVWQETLGEGGFVAVPPITAHEATAAAALQREVGDLIGSGEHVHPLALDGDPTQLLVAAAKHADMLVVGSRGRGRVGSALLGSVSAECIRRASCPVVVVPQHLVDLTKLPSDPLGVHR